MTRTHAFADPAQRALEAAMTRTDEGIDVCTTGLGNLPETASGRVDEIASLAMNEVLSDAETRFDAIYLPYPRHTHMQLQMDRVRLHGLKVRDAGGMSPMRGLRILGPTGSGKTTGVQEYLAHLERSGRYGEGRMPMIYVRLRKRATWPKVLRAILKKFGDRHARRRDEDELVEQVRNCIERAGVELIVIDECQHLKNLSNDSMIVTDELKVFLDESVLPVIFVGTDDAKPMFDANPELCGRLGEPVDLVPLTVADIDLFGEFMKRLDRRMLDLDLTSELSRLNDPARLLNLLSASGGVIGMAYRIVRAALLISISREADRIDDYDLALAVDRWAIPAKVCKSNPFLIERRAA